MKQLAGLLKWMLKAAIFFTLFAFALNNQHEVTVHFFFGHQWSGALVLAVLSAFAAGVAIGVVGMVPRWWRHRRLEEQVRETASSSPAEASVPSTPSPQPPYGI